MKKVLVAFLLLFALSGGNNKVYVCTGPQSKCYHKTTKCRGIRSCSDDIKEVTLKEAQKMGRRACKICYGSK